MKGRTLLIFITLLFVTQVFAVNALKRDPFKQPSFSTKAISKDRFEGVSGNSNQPVLNGTLRSEAGSLANVSGKILAIGEQIYGFKLIAVSEQSATLVRGEERLELVLEGSADNGSDK